MYKMHNAKSKKNAIFYALIQMTLMSWRIIKPELIFILYLKCISSLTEGDIYLKFKVSFERRISGLHGLLKDFYFIYLLFFVVAFSGDIIATIQ